MKKYCKDFTVIKKKVLTPSYFQLDLQISEPLPEIRAGQFVELMTRKSSGVLLRRPISIHDVDYSQNVISLLINIVGDATKDFSLVEEGETMNMIFPLGNGFEIVGKKPLLIGGGCGVAPLLYLARVLKEKGINSHTLIGCKTSSMLFSIDEYSSLSTLHISSEDGSEGEKGLVTEHSIMNGDFDVIYTCGPTPMMKAIAKKAQEKNTPCYVSLENTMACGVGACLCCVVDTNEGHKCTCTEGPVFLSTELKDF